MTTTLQFLIQSLPIFISIIIPGFLLALALLRKTKLHLLEIFFIGAVFGMYVPPLMAFVEFLVGISFSFSLHLINLAIICVISIAIIIKDKIEILPKTKLDTKTLYAFLALSVILFLAWWIRQQAISPYFYEFDPYWYNTITEFIIKGGAIPVFSDNAWWPNVYTYRNSPIMPFTEAGWYHIYSVTNNVTGFDFTTMTMVSSLYPALAAALMCFFAYLWLSKEYGKAIGILAAGFLAFTPILIDKTLAGEFELQPFGLFAIIFFFAFYALTMKTGSKRFALITAFAILISLLGSASGRLPIYFAVALSLVLALVKFIKNELSLDFVYLNSIIMCGAVIGVILSYIYSAPVGGELSISLLMVAIGPVAGIYFLFSLHSETKNTEEKLLYLSVLFVATLTLAVFTPLGQVFSEINTLVLGVTSYTDPTFQTIAEQIVSSGSLHSALGVLGYDFSGFSIGYVILALAIIVIVFALASEINIYLILGLVIVLPLSLTGLFKVKYIPYTGLFLPLLFCFMIGILYINKSLRNYQKYMLGIASIILFAQATQYYDVIFSSLGNGSSLDPSNNSAISAFCNSKYQEMVSAANNNSFLTEAIVSSKSITQRVYCNRIPDHWLNAMSWLRDNAAIEERTFCWWDYGHWITTFGQRKSVTDNLHVYTLMHQEVADKIVYNTPEALKQYMIEHKAEYILLDQDLIQKWGALAYHACYYNNKTTIEIGPGASACDREYSPEFVFVPLPDSSTMQMSSNNLCDSKINGNMGVKVYSPYFGRNTQNSFDHYCTTIDDLNQGLSLLQYGTTYVPLTFYYENGKKVGVTNGIYQGKSSDGNYLIFLVAYPSGDPDRKGQFYDSIFYKGFFEGQIPGFEQVHPQQNLPGPVIPVRIFKLRTE